MPAWGGVLGSALTSAANAYLESIIDAPYERLEKRKAELGVEEAEERVTKARREAAAGGPAIHTGWGVYTIDPQTGRYKLELQRPEAPHKATGQEALYERMAEWLGSDDPEKQRIAEAWLKRQQAPTRQADLRSRQIDAQIGHWQRIETYWASRADEAKRHNSAMEGRYRSEARKARGNLQSLAQAQEWLQSGTPEQQEAARTYLEKYNRSGGSGSREAPPADVTMQRLEHLQQRASGLSASLQDESQRLLDLARRYQEQGQAVPGWLGKQIDHLDTQIRQAEVRAARPPGGGGPPSQVDVPHGVAGPTSRYRGKDVERYYEAQRAALEKLAPLSEAEATKEVSRQPYGPVRDGYIEAWRTRFPGKVFKADPTIVPPPEPRRPSSGRQSRADQPVRTVDTLAQQRYGKPYAELEEAQKLELEAEVGLDPWEASGAAPAPTTPSPPARSTPPKPGTPEHRAYVMYKSEMIDVPKAQVLEAWAYISKAGSEAEKQGFRRAYREYFGEEVE